MSSLIQQSNDQAMLQKYLETVNGFDTNTRRIEGNPKAVTVIAEFPRMAEAEGFVVMAEGLRASEK